jgi:hypothetical protein
MRTRLPSGSPVQPAPLLQSAFDKQSETLGAEQLFEQKDVAGIPRATSPPTGKTPDASIVRS